LQVFEKKNKGAIHVFYRTENTHPPRTKCQRLLSTCFMFSFSVCKIQGTRATPSRTMAGRFMIDSVASIDAEDQGNAPDAPNHHAQVAHARQGKEYVREQARGIGVVAWFGSIVVRRIMRIGSPLIKLARQPGAPGDAIKQSVCGEQRRL
jgi:hypothetical protein